MNKIILLLSPFNNSDNGLPIYSQNIWNILPAPAPSPLETSMDIHSTPINIHCLTHGMGLNLVTELGKDAKTARP